MRNTEPIILCHPACSGGSLIFRIMCAQLSFLGISEKSHQYPYHKSAFLPADPQFSLYNSGVISLEEYGEIFIDRVKISIDIASEAGHRTLIREHTHSYFFEESVPPENIKSPSWIAQRLREKYGIYAKCVATVRDPIDCWLSLQQNFPDSAPPDFDQYCQYYLKFLKAAHTKTVESECILVKYEDIVKAPLFELTRIADFLDAVCPRELVQDWQNVISSGNSGRLSDTIELRKRRPVDSRLYRTSSRSDAYQEIIVMMNYPSLRDASSWTRFILAPLFQIERYLATIIVSARAVVARWARRRSFTR